MTEVASLLSASLAELKASHAAQARAIARLEEALQQAVKQGLEHLPASEALPSDHRRAHRPGAGPKIDADPELQTFTRARIDRHTFMQLEAEVAAHFPPERRVRHSAIHDWWRRGWPAAGSVDSRLS